jgi:predicted RNA-binding protein with TRAM domain
LTTWTVLAKTQHSDISPSLALAASGSVHAAFVRQGSGIRSTSNRTGTWVVEVVPGSTRGESPSVAVTAGGTPSVAFASFVSRATSILRIASKTSKGWTLRTVATGDVGQPSLKIDSLGKRHLVFVRRSGSAAGLYYATDRTGTWTTTRLTSATGVEAPRLILDAARHVHVAYVRAAPGSSRVLYVTNATGHWVTSIVSGSGNASSPELALDGSGRPVIAYTAGLPFESGAAVVAERAGAGWTQQPATTDRIAGRPGLAIDGAQLHLLALRPFADPQDAGQLIHAMR